MASNAQGILPPIEYPPPPRVHWAMLFLAFITLALLIAWLAPGPYQNLLNSLVFDSWVFYLCIWIRSLDADARSPFWCDVYLIVELSCAAMSIRQTSSGLYFAIVAILQIASLVLGIATLYLIRADLLKHYNEREPIGLYLGGLMTWFFSFLYFQSQLYPIAQQKYRQSHESATSFSS
jgi:hypothetical protein